ncbi:hypothetical protein SAMN04487969_10640 [Paenibacillus algorifonticola]|uniref:Uncharacterized protein n=1 Tax=Paenibacillus algorifonticola TaxID=684063 RepID=A0A1I2D176_9BACL|nr:hypothetical protein [Paenibacillus algorifonticola]SFE74317.1 hypothetical protein SAMN04487969_10640 [Paenibacillus algorifonticola]
MNLFKYTCGFDERYGAAVNARDAYERRAEVDPTFGFIEVKIEEVIVPHHVITIRPTGDKAGSNDAFFQNMERPELIEWLKANHVHYVPQWGDQRLREAALAAKTQN